MSSSYSGMSSSRWLTNAWSRSRIESPAARLMRGHYTRRTGDPMDQWSLYIDIEGFSSTYAKGTQALESLGALMESIYKVGSRCYAESPHRLFAHQLGDGFVVVGEFGWATLEQPVTVAIVLLRAVLQAGGLAKAAISEGEFADVVGCYPKTIQDLYERSCGGAIPLGRGLMTILPVMGAALINSYRLLHAKCTPPGPLLLLEEAKAGRLPPWVRAQAVGGFLAIDWIHSYSPALVDITRVAGLHTAEPSVLVGALRRYMESNDVSPKWRDNASRYLSTNDAA